MAKATRGHVKTLCPILGGMAKRELCDRGHGITMLTDDGYRKLCKRYDHPSHAHYLTFSCFKNQPFLNSVRTRNWLIQSIYKAQKQNMFKLWAWVIMPEHVHLLLFPQVSVSSILSAIKTPVAKSATMWVKSNTPQFAAKMSDAGPNGTAVMRFWQRGGGYDRNIMSLTELSEKVKYAEEPLKIDKESFPYL